MAKTLVVYWSKHGATKQYATWIANRLGADLMTAKQARRAELARYSTIILGSPIYNDRILGIRTIDRFLRDPKRRQNIVIFIVRLVSASNLDYSGRVANENIGPEFHSETQIFYLRGAIDWATVSRWQRFVVDFLIRRVPAHVWTDRAGFENETAQLFVEKQNVDYVDESEIKPLVDYVKKIEK